MVKRASEHDGRPSCSICSAGSDILLRLSSFSILFLFLPCPALSWSSPSFNCHFCPEVSLEPYLHLRIYLFIDALPGAPSFILQSRRGSHQINTSAKQALFILTPCTFFPKVTKFNTSASLWLDIVARRTPLHTSAEPPEQFELPLQLRIFLPAEEYSAAPVERTSTVSKKHQL